MWARAGKCVSVCPVPGARLPTKPNPHHMNSSFKLSAAVSAGLLLLATHLPAAAPATADEPGLIGKPIAGFDFAYLDYTGSRLSNTRGGSAEFNVPLAPKYDLGFTYDFSRTSGNNYRVSGNNIAATLLTYNRTEHGKAYFSGSIGHAWDKVKAAGTSIRDNGAIWAVRAGYEIPMGSQTAVNAGIGYSDPFDRQLARNSIIEYRVEANHWFNSTLAGVIAGAYQQIKDSPDAAVYSIGLRWRY